VEFFLPNTTSHLQPCDVGIIHSFKAQYKKLLVHDRIEAYETAQILEKSVTPVTIYDAICFTKKAWGSVTSTVIKNCWKHTGILPENLEFLNNVEVEVEVDIEQENHEVQDLINQLPFDDSLLADEYLNIENNMVAGELVMEDEDIVALIQPTEIEIDEQQDEIFIPSDFDVCEDELKCICTLRKKLLSHKVNSSVQQSLDKYFCLE